METTHEMLRMVEKNISKSNTIMREWHEARAMNLEENGARLRENLLRSSNDDEKHHRELLRHSRMNNGKVEPTMKRI